MELHKEIKKNKKAQEVLLKAKEFREKFIDPVANELDKKLLTDPQFHPEDIVKKGCEYGFLSLPVPSFAGGGDASILHICLLLEELSAGCAGIANIFGAHYLGLSGILMSFDLGIYEMFIREMVEQEKKGIPVLFSAAATEPSAGTDVEEEEFLPKARLMTQAKRVESGYVLNGRKVFISNGSTAKYHLIICAIDRARPVETWSGFVVPSDTKGFSVGRVELKMGQRACHAAELVFDDCFIPKHYRVGTEGKGMKMTEVVLAASRAPVGAIATGIARGAYEKALTFCKANDILKKQWVQFTLAEMYSLIVTARNLYLGSAVAFDSMIFSKLKKGLGLAKPFLIALFPLLRTSLARRITYSQRVKNITSRMVEKRIDNKLKDVSLGYSSMTKFSCSDFAMQVCLKAMELCGRAGIQESTGIEKYLRDAKLTQIYEGTNQLNRYEVYKRLIQNN